MKTAFSIAKKVDWGRCDSGDMAYVKTGLAVSHSRFAGMCEDKDKGRLGDWCYRMVGANFHANLKAPVVKGENGVKTKVGLELMYSFCQKSCQF